jgi:hypothetical protein
MRGRLSPRRRRQLVGAARGREREEAGLRTGVDAWSGRCGPRGDLAPRVTRSAPFSAMPRSECAARQETSGHPQPPWTHRKRCLTPSLEPSGQHPLSREICNRFRPWQLQESEESPLSRTPRRKATEQRVRTECPSPGTVTEAVPNHGPCDVSRHRNSSEPALGSELFRLGPLGAPVGW